MTQPRSSDRLTPLAERALRVFERDGTLTEQQWIVRLRPAYPEAVRSVLRELGEHGIEAIR